MAVSSWDTADAILSGVAVILYTVVAVFLARRKVSSHARGAQRGFVIWWGGLAFLGLYGLVFHPSYGYDLSAMGLASYVGVLYALIVGVYVMLGGLVYYLLYLYTGKRSTLWWTAGFYGIMTVFLAWLLHGFGGLCFVPDEAGCASSTWEEGDPRALGTYEERPPWVTSAWGLLLVLPPFVAGVMYFLLFFRVPDATARYRVATISLGIVLWFLFSTANALVGLAGSPSAGSAREDVVQVVSRSLGLLAASLVMVAYFPPRALRRRWGLKSLAEQGEG